jgi:hypothetical protein
MKKEFKPIALLLSAISITIILVPLGIIYNILKAIYHCLKFRPISAIIYILFYWLKVLYQIWNALKYLMMRLAVSLDLIWNATSGELIEDCVTTKEETWYGNGNRTISAATGELEYYDELNKTGIKFSKFLSEVLDKNHCIKAYEKEINYPINE